MSQARLDSEVPELRVRVANAAEVRDTGEFVLYWMTANRRTRWNFIACSEPLNGHSTPQSALAVMIELNNRYALAGRDPNSYSGIFWSLRWYDRVWEPERLICGKIRDRSSGNAARKLNVKPYLETYGPKA